MNQPFLQETVLADLPGDCDRQRTLVVLRPGLGGKSSTVEMRQQTWGEGVGWFTQSSVALLSHQVAGLRNALGLAGGQVRACRTLRPDAPEATHLRLLQADSA